MLQHVFHLGIHCRRWGEGCVCGRGQLGRYGVTADGWIVRYELTCPFGMYPYMCTKEQKVLWKLYRLLICLVVFTMESR